LEFFGAVGEVLLNKIRSLLDEQNPDTLFSNEIIADSFEAATSN
jgi:hypothetical protein